MSSKVKCPYCSNMNNKEETIAYNKRYYCYECLALALKPEEYDKHMFYLHFQKLFGRVPTVMEWTQCDRLLQQRWTWNKIEDIMEYVFAIEHLEESEEHGVIGILPYYELRARQFFEMLWNVRESESFNTDEDEQEIFCRQVNAREIAKQKVLKDVDKIWDDEELFD